MTVFKQSDPPRKIRRFGRHFVPFNLDSDAYLKTITTWNPVYDCFNCLPWQFLDLTKLSVLFFTVLERVQIAEGTNMAAVASCEKHRQYLGRNGNTALTFQSKKSYSSLTFFIMAIKFWNIYSVSMLGSLSKPVP